MDGKVLRQPGKYGHQPVMTFLVTFAVMVREYIAGDCRTAHEDPRNSCMQLFLFSWMNIVELISGDGHLFIFAGNFHSGMQKTRILPSLTPFYPIIDCASGKKPQEPGMGSGL
jgi:hypothetical protein